MKSNNKPIDQIPIELKIKLLSCDLFELTTLLEQDKNKFGWLIDDINTQFKEQLNEPL